MPATSQFPIKARYFIDFRPTDTGLTPQFKDAAGNPAFWRTDTTPPTAVAGPTITELGGGKYYFDWTWAGKTDPDYTFIMDGGPSIVTDVERYLPGSISVRDYITPSGGGGGGGGGWVIGD